MAIYYFDTSALAKRYAVEVGTAWVVEIADDDANSIYVARITGAEMVAAITKKQRKREVSIGDAAAAIADFRHDFNGQYNVLEVARPIVERAMSLAEAHPLRGYDAVQLAAALEVETQIGATRVALGIPITKATVLTFVSADDDLNAAAIAEGLAVDNPLKHP